MPVLGCWPSHGEIAPFYNGTPSSPSTNSTACNLNYVPNCYEVTNTSSYVELVLDSPTDNPWFRFVIHPRDRAKTTSFIQLLSGSTLAYEIYHTSSTWKIRKHDGTSWVDLTSTASHGMGTTRNDATFHVDLRTPSNGASETYMNDVLKNSFTGDVSVPGVTSIDRVRIYPVTNTGIYPNRYSQCMVSDQDPAGCEPFTLAPSGAGNYTAWSGDFNTVSTLDDTDSAPVAASDRATYTHANLYASAPPEVPYAAVACSAKTLSVAAGDDMNLMLRSSATDYDGSGIDLTADRELYVYDVSDIIANSVSTLNAAEPGMKAV